MLRQLIHQLALLGVALTATLVLASADGDVSSEGPEINNKCCRPATPNGPSADGCVTPCLDSDDIICQGEKITAWTPGGCQSKEDKFCTENNSKLFKPKFVCVEAGCVKEDGTAGKMCLWAFQGQSTEGKKNVKTCSGNPCG